MQARRAEHNFDPLFGRCGQDNSVELYPTTDLPDVMAITKWSIPAK